MNHERTKLSLDQDREQEMIIIECAKCGQSALLSLQRPGVTNLSNDLEFRGIVRCSGEGHEWPMAIKTDNIIQNTAQMMPVLESTSLSQKVPVGIVQDIQEAERDHFAQSYKSAVVMCRRALQLALEDKGVTGRTLGPMLTTARSMTPPLLSARTDALAEGIKDYGDGGAHRREDIDAATAALVIHVTAQALNEIFP
jgi:hypothetical protein